MMIIRSLELSRTWSAWLLGCEGEPRYPSDRSALRGNRGYAADQFTAGFGMWSLISSATIDADGLNQWSNP